MEQLYENIDDRTLALVYQCFHTKPVFFLEGGDRGQ
jgi:hypothetical protein